MPRSPGRDGRAAPRTRLPGEREEKGWGRPEWTKGVGKAGRRAGPVGRRRAPSTARPRPTQPAPPLPPPLPPRGGAWPAGPGHARDPWPKARVPSCPGLRPSEDKSLQRAVVAEPKARAPGVPAQPNPPHPIVLYPCSPVIPAGLPPIDS